jgi:hypothetical protein
MDADRHVPLSIDLAEIDTSPEVASERSLLHDDARVFSEGTLRSTVATGRRRRIRRLSTVRPSHLNLGFLI